MQDKQEKNHTHKNLLSKLERSATAVAERSRC